MVVAAPAGHAGVMDLLVLGGGGFLGYHAVAEALAAGHRVTTFSRHSEPVMHGVATLVGDRSSDLSALRGQDFDAVVDTTSDADAVRATAELLRGRVGAYGFVSGMSVYAPDGPSVPDESAPVRRAGAGYDDDVLQARSLKKLACEDVLAEELPDTPVTIARVGIMTGPRDPSDRFTWWPVRVARALAGRADTLVLAPGDPARSVQHSDARDIAGWLVSMLDRRRGGTFNAVGPGRTEPVGEVLAACARAAGAQEGDVEWVWADETFTAGQLADVTDEQRPLWFPEAQIPQVAIDSSAAIAEGLTFRPAEQTAADVLALVREEGRLDDLAAGWPGERERDLVGRWRALAV